MPYLLYKSLLSDSPLLMRERYELMILLLWKCDELKLSWLEIMFYWSDYFLSQKNKTVS